MDNVQYVMERLGTAATRQVCPSCPDRRVERILQGALREAVA